MTPAVQAPVLLSQEKVYARVSVPTQARVLLVSIQERGWNSS